MEEQNDLEQMLTDMVPLLRATADGVDEALMAYQKGAPATKRAIRRQLVELFEQMAEAMDRTLDAARLG